MERRNKNIVIVAHHYPPHITGVGMVAQNHAKRLAALGYNVTVITSETSPEEKSYSADGVDVVRIKAWNISEQWSAPFPIFSPSLFPALWKAVRRADVVHIHDVLYMSSFLAAMFARWQKKPIVLTQHIAMIAHPSRFVVVTEKIVYATTGAMILRSSNLIFTFNSRVEQFLINRGVPRAKITSLPNGVDTDLFLPADEKEKQSIRLEYKLDLHEKIVLFVGRSVPKKGLDKVLAARSKEYQIVCAGGEIPKENYDDIVFLGKLDQKTLARIYQAADIFLLPSESEGFPLSIQEAMACGLPIITTLDEGYKDYQLDRTLIYFIDHPTDASVRSAIQAIINEDQRLENMGDYSRKYAVNNFSWPLVISRLDKIYNSLLIKKKIAIISDAVYPFNKGGKEKRIYDIATRLATRGYDVTIYCMQWWKGGRTFVQDGVTLHAISPYYPLYAGNRRSIKEAIFFALNCFKLINKKFDIIEVDHMPHLVLFTVKFVCLLKHKRMIAVWHEVWGKEYWKQYLGVAGIPAYWIERVSAKLPDTIISVSSHTTRDLRNVLKTKRRIVTIPDGLDIKGIAKNIPAKSGADIIFAGRLLAHKNIDVLLRAVAILTKTHPTISALIIGEGPERKRLESLARELKLQGNVSFLDFFEDHNDLYRVMRASRVFVLPSTREGFGMVVIEANACGLPVVAIENERNAAKDLIAKNENGVLCILDKNKLAEMIEKVLSIRKNSDFYSKYSERYDWTHIMPKIENLYLT